MASLSPDRYRGDFVAWSGGCAFIGEGGATVAPHAHYAIQLVIGAPGGLRVQSGRHGDWQSCAAALIPSRKVHSIDVSACEWATVAFIEPDTLQGKALAARLAGAPALLPADEIAAGAQRLHHAWQVERSLEAVQAAYRQLVGDVSRAAAPQASDARVLAALDYLHARVDRNVPLDEVAAAANLSPGRFRHLFVQETGMPLRTYQLWRRLLHVWNLVMQGENLTAAAHGAGFADAAHLSRTARTMFGLAPSALQMNGPLAAHARALPITVAAPGRSASRGTPPDPARRSPTA